MTTGLLESAAVRPRPRWDRQAVAFALALGAAVYLAPLAVPFPLLDPDEGIHAAISRLMAERGDLVTPWFAGEPFLDKPILFFWLQAGALQLLGASEFAARLPGLLMGLLGAVTTGLLGLQWYGRRVALLAACVQATLVMPALQAQAGAHDVTLVVWSNLAMLASWQATYAYRWRRALLAAGAAGVCLGGAMLTKGLVGPVLVLAPLGVTLLAHRRVTWRTVGLLAVALAVAAAIAAPWYLQMEALHPGYLHYYLVQRHVGGFTTDAQLHGGAPWWYYLPVMLVGGWPWVLLLPSAPPPGESPDPLPPRLLWNWLLGDLLLLSVSGSKLATYVLPIFPPLALLAAVTWAVASRRPTRRSWRGITTALLLSALVWPLLLGGLVIAAGRLFDVHYSPLALGPIALLAAAGVVPWLAWRARRDRWSFGALAGVTAGALLYAVTVLLPPIAPALSARDLGAYLNRQPALPPQVVVIDERVGSVLFYLRPDLRASVTPRQFGAVGAGEAAPLLRQLDPAAVVAVRSGRAGRLLALVGADRAAPFDQAGAYRVFRASALGRHPSR